ncbi:MAG: WD40 repeat domain-containing protein [Planctomycetota bacterium]
MSARSALAAWILAACAAQAQEERKPPPLRTAFSLGDRAYRTFAWSADGVFLAAGAEGALRIRDLRAPRPLETLLPADGRVEQLFFDAGANILVARTSAWQPRLWDARSWKPVRFALEDLNAGGLALRASWQSDDPSIPLVLVNPSRGIRLWRIGPPRGNLRCILQIDLRDWAGKALRGVTTATWADAALLLGSQEGIVYELPEVRSLLTQTNPDDAVILGRLAGSSEKSRLLRLHRGAVSLLAPTADGARFVTAGADGKVRLWNPDRFPEGRPRKPAEPEPEWEIPGHAADLSPDGRIFAVADAEGVGVYHAGSGAALSWNPARSLGGTVVQLRFSPDAKALAAIVCRCRGCAAGGARPGLRGGDHAGEVVVWK